MSALFAYDDLRSKIIVVRHFREESYLFFWRCYRHSDVRITVTDDMSFSALRAEIRKAFSLPDSEEFAFSVQGREIRRMDELRDKELYVVSSR